MKAPTRITVRLSPDIPRVSNGISVGPFTGHYDPDHITIHIRMQSEHLCRDAQQRIMFAQYTYQHLQPNLLINADCQPDIPVGYNNP